MQQAGRQRRICWVGPRILQNGPRPPALPCHPGTRPRSALPWGKVPLVRTLSPSTCQDCVPGRAVESSVQGSEPGGRHGPRCEPSLCVVPAHAVRRSCLTSRVQTRPPTPPGPQVTFPLQRVAALARSGGEVWLWHWAKLAANLQFSTCPIRLTNPAHRAPLKIRQGARHAQTTSHTPRGSAGRAQRAPVRARAGDGGGGAAPHTGERAAPWHQGRPSRKPARPGPPWREPRPAGYGLRPPRRTPSLLRRPSQFGSSRVRLTHRL